MNKFKVWMLNTFFKKELVGLGKLSLKMQSKENRSEWDNGFICGVHHATQELIASKLN